MLDCLKFLFCDWKPHEEREIENTELDNGFEIDTCWVDDMQYFETGIINHNSKEEWVIVESYTSQEMARQNHKKWVDFAKTSPKSAYSIQFGVEIDF